MALFKLTTRGVTIDRLNRDQKNISRPERLGRRLGRGEVTPVHAGGGNRSMIKKKKYGGEDNEM